MGMMKQLASGEVFEQQNTGEYPAMIKEAAHRVRMHQVSWGRTPRARCSKCLQPSNERGECVNCNTIRIMVSA